MTESVSGPARGDHPYKEPRPVVKKTCQKDNI